VLDPVNSDTNATGSVSRETCILLTSSTEVVFGSAEVSRTRRLARNVAVEEGSE
jgi:hypothetical protein